MAALGEARALPLAVLSERSSRLNSRARPGSTIRLGTCAHRWVPTGPDTETSARTQVTRWSQTPAMDRATNRTPENGSPAAATTQCQAPPRAISQVPLPSRTIPNGEHGPDHGEVPRLRPLPFIIIAETKSHLQDPPVLSCLAPSTSRRRPPRMACNQSGIEGFPEKRTGARPAARDESFARRSIAQPAPIGANDRWAPVVAGRRTRGSL